MEQWIEKQRNIWSQREGWFYILISLIGNLFPIWFKVFIGIIDGKCGYDICNDINSPFTYLLITISFSSMTIYLWQKHLKFDEEEYEKSKEQTHNNLLKRKWMIIYVLIIFPLLGYLISREQYITKYLCNLSICIYSIFTLVLLVYIYFKLKDFAEEKNLKLKQDTTVTKEIKNEMKSLNDQLNSKL